MQFTDYLTHPYLFIGLIILWFTIFAWIVNKSLDAIIHYFIAKTKTKADDKVFPVVKRSLLAGLLVTALYLISLYLPIVQEYFEHLERFYIASLIVIGGFFLSGVLSVVFIEFGQRSESKNGDGVHPAVPFLNNLIRIGIFSAAALLILNMYEIDITPALASAGVVGIAVAFAAKDFVANLFGGVSVFFDNPYTVGDYVIINELYRGEVQDIGMRSTKIKTRDDVLLTVPNSVMVTNVVVNETGYVPKLRVRIPVQVGYESDLEHVEKVLDNVAESHDEVIKDPAPRVRCRSFNDSGINMELLIVIAEPSEKGRITHELIKDIHKRFGEEDIRIPFPRRDVFMHNVE